MVVKTTTQGRPKNSSGPSPAAIAAAAIAAVIALCALIWAIAHMEAYEPRWVLSARHGIAEAGLRASATFAELLDWARLGR